MLSGDIEGSKIRMFGPKSGVSVPAQAWGPGAGAAGFAGCAWAPGIAAALGATAETAATAANPAKNGNRRRPRRDETGVMFQAPPEMANASNALHESALRSGP
ncbi:hypothetical protein GCM10027597_37420 [Saccharopolyspora tripterygii]